MANALTTYTAAQIAKIENIKDAAYVKEMADAATVFYRAQDDWQNSQKAREVALRSVRQAGIILLPPDQGGRTARAKGGRPENNSFHNETSYQTVLDEAGISEVTGHRWQKVARVPGDKFEAYFAEAEYKNEEYSVAGLMKFAGEWYGRSDVAEWSTPQWLFDLLDAEFHFTLDVCAQPENAKCRRFYTKQDDALSPKRKWVGVCWMNPPYGREIGDWMTKARIEAENGATIVCLVPARPDTNWWWDNALSGEMRFIKGRVKWQDNSDTAAPFPSAVVVLGPDRKRRVVWWDVRPS